MRHSSPWGFLVPLRGDLPPLQLRGDGARVALDRHGAILCADAGNPAPAGASGLFCVWREARTGAVLLRIASPLVRVDDRPVPGGESVALRHGQSVAFGRADATYVYVNSTESDAALPSELRKQYLAGNCLKRGGFGKMCLLFEKGRNYQRRALKIVDAGNKKKHPKYVQQKGENLTTLKHPCLINVYYDQQLNMQRVFVLEYMSGGDLKQLINNKNRLTEVQSKLIFFQLALAIQYLHDRNMCHLNLKPENVLLERSDPYTLIKVTDFGLAKDVKGITALKTTPDSIPYLAPEIINEEYYSLNSADVWSMGTLLFYMLTGALPFKNSDEAVLRRHEVEFAQALWGDVSRDAQQLLRAMLKAKPKNRLSATQVVECLWLRDKAMRKDAAELTGLKDLECNTPTSHHRVVYIGTESEYICLESGSSPRLKQRYRRCLRRLQPWARMIVYSSILLVLMFSIFTVFKQKP